MAPPAMMRAKTPAVAFESTAERAHPRGIQASKRLSDAPTHRATDDNGGLPAHVIEQLREVLCE